MGTAYTQKKKDIVMPKAGDSAEFAIREIIKDSLQAFVGEHMDKFANADPTDPYLRIVCEHQTWGEVSHLVSFQGENPHWKSNHAKWLSGYGLEIGTKVPHTFSPADQRWKPAL